MTEKQYDKLKQAIQDKFDLEVSLLEARRVSQIEALDTVYAMINTVKTRNNVYGSVTKNVKRVVEGKEVPDIFTKRDIIRAFGCSVSTHTLDGCLRRLVRQEFLVIVEKGKGSGLSKYKLSETAKAFAETQRKE